MRLWLVLALVWTAGWAASCGREAPSFAPGSITVTSTPSGAAIYLNGRDAGFVTPHTFAELDRNLYVVSVQLAGHVAAPGSVPVDLAPLDDVVLQFELSQTGLLLTSEPSGAAILINGVATGLVTPAEVGGLDPGLLEVSLQLADWIVSPASLSVLVEAGRITAVPGDAFTLTPQRTVVLEGFANINCIPCPQLTANLIAFAGQPGFGTDRVIYLEYAVSWPNVADPFYTHNPTENAERYTSYVVLGAPALYCNGVKLADALDADAMRTRVQTDLQTDPGFRITVAADFANQAVTGQVTLTAATATDLTGSRLFVALYEEVVDFNERGLSPGTNGQTEFHHVFRDRMDSRPPLGVLTPGTPTVIDLTLSRNTSWPTDNLVVVAFVQRDSDRRILQAGSVSGSAPAKGIFR